MNSSARTGRPFRPTRLPPFRPLRRVAETAFALLLLAACAGLSDPQEAALAERFEHMTGTAMAEIETVHLDPPAPEALAFAALDGLQRIAPRLTFAQEGEAAVARYLDGRLIASVDLPATESVDLWADRLTDLVFATRAEVPALAAAEEETLYRAFFDGMLSRLDRFSRYAGREDAREAREEREGFGGIGVRLDSHPDGARVADVEPTKPADAAGLLIGDVLVAIDGEPIGGEPVRRVLEMLRGPIDQPVIVTLRRERVSDPLTVTVGRTRIVPDTIVQRRDGAYAVIEISSFNQRTSKRLAEAIASARAHPDGAPAGIILDLRGNPGGLLDQAVSSADLFLDHGLISRADGRHPNSHQRFMAEPGDLAAGLPLAVLVNGASASAAEILASALQDQGRAALIGMTSFGKGTIQTVVSLPNDGELYLTWARFVAPSGYPLQRLGVGPTICTSGARDAVRALDQALRVVPSDGAADPSSPVARRRLLGPEPDDGAIREILAICPWQPHEGADIDLAVARMLLDSPTLYDKAIEIARQAPTS